MDVNMMSLRGEYFNYSNEPEGLPLASCSLPYSGDKISMTIILPHKGQNLLELESKIDENVFQKILSCQRVEKVDLYLPRFKFEKSYEVIKLNI
jgi:serine protease inhibitor